MILMLVAAVAVALLTWTLGWWGVVIAALIIGAVQWRRRGIAWMTALAAIVAWAALLLVDAASGRLGALASTMAGVMRIPAAALVVVTLLFSGLLAWSAAVVGQLAGALTSRRADQ
ncbi:MAG: hypothetical protein JWL95_1614 [Gemmatimonadetes bacterium]|nr:hypothetical protein [Gemmatimonadota bacterium]